MGTFTSELTFGPYAYGTMVEGSISYKTIQPASTYSAEATAYFAAMSVQPDATRKALLNTLINNLVASGVWAKLSWLSIHAAHDEQAARVNAVTPSQVMSVGVAPTFTTDRGHTGNGTTQYLNSGWSQTVNGGSIYTQNSAHIGAWLGTDVTNGAQTDLGVASHSLIIGRVTTVLRTRVNETATALDATLGVATSVGHSLITRSGAAATEAYKNATSIGTSANASAALSAQPIYVCAANSAGTAANFSTRRIQASHWGGHLTAANVTSLYNELSTYMTAVGA